MHHSAVVFVVLFVAQNLSGQLFGPQVLLDQEANGARDVACADLNNDGWIDVISINSIDDKVVLYQNNGDETFLDGVELSSLVVGVWNVELADSDSDGDIDIFVNERLNNQIVLLENLGFGNFSAPILVATSLNPCAVKLGDINGDGYVDVCFGGCQISEGVNWVENLGSNQFGPITAINLNIGTVTVYALSLFDIDNDLDIDVVCGGNIGPQGDYSVVWFENQGNGVFNEGEVNGISELTGPLSLNSADINGDGYADIIETDGGPGYGHVAWYKNSGFSQTTFREQISNDFTSSVTDVALFDFDNDLDIDVACTGGIITWHKNDGVGNFLSPEVISTNVFENQSLEGADFNNDGFTDLVSADSFFDEVAVYYNQGGLGCMDVSACNYNPSSTQDNGSCCYENCGCLMEWAEDFDTQASCPDSCSIQLEGKAFLDLNYDGIFNEMDEPLSGQAFLLLPDSIYAFSNLSGDFLIQTKVLNELVIQYVQNEQYPWYTTPISYDLFDINISEGQLSFGLYYSEEEFYSGQIDVYPVDNEYLCDNVQRHRVVVRNNSNRTVSGSVVLVLAESFSNLQSVEAEVSGNTLTYDIGSISPTQTLEFYFEATTPSSDFLAQEVLSESFFYIYLDGVSELVDQGIFGQIVYCEGSQRRKQVFPAGYTDAHYVPESDYLEYLVRFQNTGNAPATDVIIRDTIQEGLDISTFELVANSHSVFTTVNPSTREVEFYFQGIQLPDSVNNEPESHGLVSYRIRPEEGLPLLTELNNTAYIFFDNNPPIVTNTTWSTIYNCSLFEVEFTQNGAILTASEGDSYQWYLDGEPIEGAIFQIFEAFGSGEYAVEISNDFPCSELTASVFILVDAIDELANSPIVLFPNPMTTSAILDLGELRGDFTLEVFDVKGQLMRSESLNLDSGTLNLSRGELNSGQYLLRLSNEDDSFELSFVVE